MSTLVFTRRACLEGRRDKSTSIELCASMVAKLECHLINTQGPVTDPLTEELWAYITGSVDQELLLRNEYLAAENRILRNQDQRAIARATSTWQYLLDMQRNETGAGVFEGKLERPSQLAGVHCFGTLAPSVAFFKSATPNREASIEELTLGSRMDYQWERIRVKRRVKKALADFIGVICFTVE